MAAQTAHGAPSQKAFQQAFEGRLIALGKAHDQLTLRHWENADLRSILAAITAPYGTHSEDQIVLVGEGVTLPPRAALTLAMAFHELATNAAKYGALSVPRGKVEIRWDATLGRLGTPSRLQIGWHEQGGPPVHAPARRGFGTKFIESSISFELGGTAQMSFDRLGVRCIVDMPVETDGPAAAAERV